MLLDVAALADEVVLGLVAGEAALGLGTELGAVALGSAGNLALGKHGGGSASAAARFEVVRSGQCLGGASCPRQAEMDEAIDPLFG